MKNVVRSFALVITIIFLAMSPICGSKQPFSLTIAPPKEPLKAGMELRLLVTITNTWNRSIIFDEPPGSQPEDGIRYEIDVRDAQWRPAPPSSYVRNRDKRIPIWYGSTLGRTLQPGESLTDQVTVTTFYDLSQPGKYTISVARAFQPWQNLGMGRVKSNTITITVVPAAAPTPAAPKPKR